MQHVVMGLRRCVVVGGSTCDSFEYLTVIHTSLTMHGHRNLNLTVIVRRRNTSGIYTGTIKTKASEHVLVQFLLESVL